MLLLRLLRRLEFRALLVILAFGSLPYLAHAQQSYPGTALFSYQCQSSGILFSHEGNPVIQVSLNEIAGPLASAIQIRQNQPIKYGAEFSLWALQSNELQIHRNSDPDGTKLVLKSNICGEIITPGSIPGGGTYSGEALAYVQLNGPGQALAYAQITASGQVLAYSQVQGSGMALAYAQANVTPRGAKYHIVREGENLFRISLRYGTTVSILAAINNISDPTLIFVGQKIYLP
jgi:LysM repeat protein